jgi:hypothetical protein
MTMDSPVRTRIVDAKQRLAARGGPLGARRPECLPPGGGRKRESGELQMASVARGSLGRGDLERAFIAAGLMAALAAGCSSSKTESPASGSAADAAAPGTNAPKGERVPRSVFDSGAPTTGKYCAFQTTADCDGNEDCPSGQTCCGLLNPNGGAYDKVTCQDKCEGDTVRPICHDGDVCPNPNPGPDGSAPLCIRSTILPAYLAICGVPGTFTPKGFVGKPAAAHQINCGPDLSCGPGTKCCVLTTWDAATRAQAPTGGYCAKTDEICSCEGAPK